MIAVADFTGEQVVIWHVQDDPSKETSTLVGAWIVDHGSPEMRQLLNTDTVLPIGEQSEGAQAEEPASGEEHKTETSMPAGKPITLDDLAAGFSRGREEIQQAMDEELERNPKLKRLRLEKLQPVDPSDFVASFHGAPEAQRCWTVASAAADIIEQWTKMETLRRSRTYLKERFGAQPRPLPIGASLSQAAV